MKKKLSRKKTLKIFENFFWLFKEILFKKEKQSKTPQ